MCVGEGEVRGGRGDEWGKGRWEGKGEVSGERGGIWWLEWEVNLKYVLKGVRSEKKEKPGGKSDKLYEVVDEDDGINYTRGNWNEVKSSCALSHTKVSWCDKWNQGE